MDEQVVGLVTAALPATIVVRHAVPDDDPVLRAWHATTLPEGVADGPLAAMQFEAQRRGLRAAFPGGDELVAERDGVTVGRLWLADEGDGLRIVDLIVAPRHRRGGIARELVTAVQRAACRHGAVRLLVDHHADAARALYDGLGFRPDPGATADPFRAALVWRTDDPGAARG